MQQNVSHFRRKLKWGNYSGQKENISKDIGTEKSKGKE